MKYVVTLKVEVTPEQLEQLIPSATIDVELYNPSANGSGYVDGLKGEITEARVKLNG